MVTFIDQHRVTYGVEPICAVLPIAPSTSFLRKAQQQEVAKRSARARRDADLRAAIQRVWDENDQVYGPRKMWKQLRRRAPAWRLDDRAPHARDGAPRSKPRTCLEDHDPAGSGRRPANRSRGSPLHGDAAESALVRGFYLRGHVARLCLHGVRD